MTNHRQRRQDVSSASASTAAVAVASSSTCIGTRSSSTMMPMPEQRTENDREQHLYLVFDDWEYGYSIRKVSLSRRSGKRAVLPLLSESDSTKGAADQGSGKDAEPLPVFMCIPAKRGYPYLFTSAFGTKIIGLIMSDSDDGVPTVDVQERNFVLGPGLILGVSPIYFPVGDDKLFALNFCMFEILQKLGHNGPWEWKELSFPPFMLGDVESYGVLPNGSILVSTSSRTYMFDIEEYVWKLYGCWAFPFTGRGLYDPSLEGFVGLSKEPETLRFGHLYFCSMVSAMAGDAGELHPSPDIKCTKEKVYTKNPAERHISATLLHMRQGRFCLVECVCIDSGMTDQELREPYTNPKFMKRGCEGGGPNLVALCIV